MPKSNVKDLGSVCTCQCVCTYACVFGSPYSLSATQEEKQEKALEPLSLPFSFFLLCGSFLNLFPHKISMLIANGLSCHGLCGPPGPQKRVSEWSNDPE